MTHNLDHQPFRKILYWTIPMLSFFSLVLYPHFQAGLESDASGFSYIILFVFFIGVVGSLIQAWMIKTDAIQFVLCQSALQTKDSLEAFSLNRISSKLTPLVKLLKICKNYNSKQLNPDVNAMVENYAYRRSRFNKTLSSFSSILVTLGLIGTIIGLINSISGLKHVINSVGASKVELIQGMKSTMEGMGTAFYTTFFGALLGGIILKVLCRVNQQSLALFCIDVHETLEYFFRQQPRLSPVARYRLNVEDLKETLHAFNQDFAPYARELIMSFDALNSKIESLLTKSQDNVSEIKIEGGEPNAGQKNDS